MPDPTLKTVSASQVPALFHRSPYTTRFLLHEQFKGRIVDEVVEEDRMAWGTALEPVILNHAAAQLRAEVLPHDQRVYMTSPGAPVGCTPDGFCLDPQRGLGIIEAKNVDFFRHSDTWHENAAPDYIELQHQTQLMVPHPELGLPKWGAIAVLIGGHDFVMHMRQPDETVQKRIAEEAARFLADVENDNIPKVTGVPMELPAVNALFPTVVEKKWLTKDDFGDDWEEVAEMISEYAFWKDRESKGKKFSGELKTKLVALCEDANGITLPGVFLKISKSATKESSISLPDDIVDELIAASDTEQMEEATNRAADWRQITKKAGITVRLTAKKDQPSSEED